jgi:2-isopropylmalate synthase
LAVWSLDYLHTSAGSSTTATATLTLSKEEASTTDAAIGDGPVDAVINCIDRICGISGQVEDYRLRAVTKGRDALGEVSVRVNFPLDERSVQVGGKGLSTDIVEASALAYLDAVNRLGFQAQRKSDRTNP